MTSNVGVLLLAHGTVSNNEQIPEFLRQIRRGRPASPALVSEMQHRYDAIGGSPLLETTREQAVALGRSLQMPAFVGMRFGARPTIADGLRDATAADLSRVCLVPMAPFSVHVYAAAADEVCAELELPVELVSVDAWGSEPGLVAALAESIQPRLERRSDEALVLTAHSLPMRAISAGDPYQIQFERCAAQVLARLSTSGDVAYQSEGAGGGQWLGPSLGETMKRLSRAGKRRLVVAPIGFPCDHVETLFDLDIEARADAEALGLELVRVRTLGVDPQLIAVLAGLVRRAIGAGT